jgi:AraC-like DNA-binding protein
MGLDTKTEKTLEKIRRQIVQQDKRRRRMLQYFDLAIERITTGASIAELAKRHHLSEEKVRRYIDRAVLLARSRMFER